MSHKWQIMALVLTGAAIMALNQARADERNKETNVTLSAPMEIPGRVLPTGTYVFQLADSQTDREVVQIFNEDKTHIIATIVASNLNFSEGDQAFTNNRMS